MQYKNSVSILSYNCHLFGNYWFSKLLGLSYEESFRRRHIIENILKIDADIVCLQEVWFKQTYNFFRSKFNKSHYIYRPHGLTGQLVISKYPILKSYFETYKDLIFPDYITNKGFGILTIEKNSRKFNIVFTHAQANAKNITIKNLNQLKSVIRLLKNPTIVVGDFNLERSFINKIFNTFPPSSREHTCSSKNALFIKYEGGKDRKLDYTLCDKNFKRKFSQTGNKIKNISFKISGIDLSDHYPIFSEFLFL